MTATLGVSRTVEPTVEPTAEPKVSPMTVSVIVLVTERPEPLAELYREFAAPLREAGLTHEFLFVADHSQRALTADLLALADQGEPIRVLEVGHQASDAVLLKLAASRARGQILLTMPAYRRIEASALPGLVRAVEAGSDLAVARRWPRHDAWINQVQNRMLHWLIGDLSAGRIHDVASGVRAMRRDIVDQIPLYGDFFRFLPLLALREGFRVEEVNCAQHARDFTTRIYHPGIYLRRLLDLVGLFFLLRFTEKPLRFFGLLGSVMSAAGGVILVVTAIQRLFGQKGLAERPVLLLGVLLVVLGVQSISLGLVGEMIVHLYSSRRSIYRLRSDGSR